MRIHLPNFLTCLNLLSGCIAVVMIFNNNLEAGAYFVFVSALFDLLDGMAARGIAVNSAFGKELDSLADAVSFGLVPGAMMHKLFLLSDPELFFHETTARYLQFFPFIITIFSALRLAKFNLDTRQTTSFIGLPTPANTLFIISLPLMLTQFPGNYEDIILNPYFILITSALSSFMLVSKLPLFSMKFKTLDFKENLFQYLLLIIALILLPIFLFAAIPMLFILYIILSLIQNNLKPKSIS